MYSNLLESKPVRVLAVLYHRYGSMAIESLTRHKRLERFVSALPELVEGLVMSIVE